MNVAMVDYGNGDVDGVGLFVSCVHSINLE